MDEICQMCGGVVRVGDWPFCGGDASKHVPPEHFGEDPLEPYFDEHISTDGEWITSRAQRRAIMAKSGLDYRKKLSPPGARVYIDLGRR